MDLRPSLYGFDREELIDILSQEGAPRYRAEQILEWIYKKHIGSWGEAKNIPQALKDKLSGKYPLISLQGEDAEEGHALPSQTNPPEALKFLFKTLDGRFLESVLISQPASGAEHSKIRKERLTVCVSTQLGCKIGCVFCASGKGKFGRNLSAGEIVEQVAWIERKLKRRITNIVFMGMGEPLDNFEATMKALKIFQAPWGFALSARRITVSTSGIVPKILEFVKRSEGRVRLSVSLHSSREDKRSELVPINKRYSLKELEAALGKIHKDLKREITFEYTLLDGVNDSRQEAEGVARLARPLGAKVNIIPYNPIREMAFKTPSKEKVQAFQVLLEKKGVKVFVRQTAGRNIDAACGQLRLDREEKSLAFHRPRVCG